ncbi:hypothetical protein fHeYen902_133 [Yersinia phage fHe-Yen9-02]|nr:hypothetical protein fHeYen902_133 [Yersinia phage fHe-Yen9-02]
MKNTCIVTIGVAMNQTVQANIDRALKAGATVTAVQDSYQVELPQGTDVTYGSDGSMSFHKHIGPEFDAGYSLPM